jgi:hypothetical protein
MYHIHYAGHGDSWCIVDESLAVRFVGSKDQAEDWLDFQENARSRPSVASLPSLGPLIDAATHGILRFFTAIRGRFGSGPVAHR